MSTSTHGLRLKTDKRWLRSTIELLSSMRFAITLLTVICIASIIGTVLKQQEPYGNYVNQFGPFWAEVFGTLGLYAVYSAWWFLLILFFLVVSTSLCVIRNTPQILKDLKNFKEHLRVQSFKAFAHNATSTLALSHDAAVSKVQQGLQGMGFKFKTQVRDGGTLIAARTGAGHKWGYIAAHSAIVLVCVGGLMDGDLFTKAQMWLGDKQVFTGGGMIADVPESSRLSPSNPAYRANVMVAEGERSGIAILQQPKGVLLQELPFVIELKKFVVEHYSTGMPKLFASEIVIHDKATGKQTPARVEVNHPVGYKGVNIYQSSFDDGGSSVTLQATPINGLGKSFEVKGVIGSTTPLSAESDKMTLEYTALRVLNVETFGAKQDAESGAKKKDLRNVGPSITYKLRDGAGQAREYHNYMLPVRMNDSAVPQFMWGVRDNPNDPFRYWRIPADDKSQMATFLNLLAAVHNDKAVNAAIDRYLVGASKPETRAALKTSAERVMQMFAKGGLGEIADFLEKNVPEAQREKTSEVLIRIMNGVLFELAGKPAFDNAPEWMNLAVLAISDAPSYPSPLLFTLKDFTQVQASVFQVAKAPGQTVVYLGAVLLIIGVFFMLYVRERRVWVWVEKSEAERTPVQIAYSSNRKTFASDDEFGRLRKLVCA